MFGETAGRIAINVFFVNPHDGRYLWNAEKSSVIIADGNEKGSKKVPSSFYDSNIAVGDSLAQMVYEHGKQSAKEKTACAADSYQEDIMNRRIEFDE